MMKAWVLSAAGFLLCAACSKKPPKVTPPATPPLVSSSQTDSPESGSSPVVSEDETILKVPVDSIKPAASPLIAGGASGTGDSVNSSSIEVPDADSSPLTPVTGGSAVADEDSPPKENAAEPATVLSQASAGPAPAGSSVTAIEVAEPPVPPPPASASDPAELKEMAEKLGYDITWDEIVNSDSVKGRGGSHLSDFYLFIAINLVNLRLKEEADPVFKAEIVHLCQDSNCAKGLDITKINPDAMGTVLGYFSLLNLFPVDIHGDDSDLTKLTETILFLQGYLSSPEWGPGHYRIAIEQEENYEKPGDLPHRQAIRQKVTDNENITEILVNLPHQFGPGLRQQGLYQHYDANVFIELGRFIKERNLNLRIVGGCGTYCVNYLLPAAQTIIIEPYGYIYTEGSIHGLLMGGETAAPAQTAYQLQKFEQEWLPMLKKPQPESDKSVAKPDNLLVRYVTDGMLITFGLEDASSIAAKKTPRQRTQMAQEFMENLKDFGQSRWGADKWQEFSVSIVAKYQHEKNKLFISWAKEDIKEFVRGMDNERRRYFLEELALFIKMYYISVETKGWNEYLSGLQWLERYTVPYHKELGRHLHSQTPYTYAGLLDLVSHLVKDTAYEKAFSVSKVYYAVPEEDKPDVAALSAGLLKKLGMDVRGENNREMLVKTWGDKVLYLNEEVIQNCRFFESLYSHIRPAAGLSSQAHYTKETFEKCTTLP